MATNKLTVGQIKTHLADGEFSRIELEEWRSDSRKGVRTLMGQFDRQMDQRKAKKAAFNERLAFERIAWADQEIVAGIDEVGRGPLAGPVVAAAVVIDENFDLQEVHDSKQLSLKARQELDLAIKNKVVDYAFGVISVEMIDQVNIYEASRLAMKLAVENLTVKPQRLLIDAMTVELELPQEKLIKGDDHSISIGAASILAKNFRDALMQDYARTYPGYDFEHNAGYGTVKHLQGMAELGITPIHRRSFAPVKKYL
jgi:ribonuclease HII